ncbi:MAG: hypothetical protein J6C50_04470 [Rickettsiales bacterium]|nr:hypothetical protein [Rickettsiales bacterium]
MIELIKEDFLAKGSHRNIYKYKDERDRCLKVVMPEGQKVLKQQNKHWYKKVRPTSWYNENKKEIKAYKKLNKKNLEIFNYIPKFYGIVKTNLGNAMLIDYITNSIPIGKYIKTYGLTNQLKEQLYEMFGVFYKNNVQIRDPHLDNCVIQICENNKIKIKLIDGIGNSQLIPIADYVSCIGKKQLLKRIQKLFNNIYKEFPEYTNTLSLDYIKKYGN